MEFIQIRWFRKSAYYGLQQIFRRSSQNAKQNGYGDLGRFHLYVNSSISVIRYWFRLLQMINERFPHRAYQMMLELDRLGKDCWVSKIKEIL